MEFNDKTTSYKSWEDFKLAETIRKMKKIKNPTQAQITIIKAMSTELKRR